MIEQLQELFEVPCERLDKIDELRAKIIEAELSAAVVFTRKDDRFLLRFLRARKFNIERALKLYLNYYKYRHKYAHLLGELTVDSVEHVLKRDFFALLDSPMNTGSKILVVFPSRYIPCKIYMYVTVCMCGAELTWTRYLQWIVSRLL